MSITEQIETENRIRSIVGEFLDDAMKKNATGIEISVESINIYKSFVAMNIHIDRELLEGIIAKRP